MSMYNQKHYSLLFANQSGRKLHTKIEVFNEKEIKVGSFEGVATDGQVSLSSDSTYRRVGNLDATLLKDLLPTPESRVWFNRRVRVYVGLEDWDEKIYWYILGRFAIDKVSAQRSIDDGSINLNLLDYMSFLDGTLGGNLTHQTNLTVESGAKVSESIRACVEHLPNIMIEKLQIDGLDAELPYDLEFSPNQTIYDMLKELTELYMKQEFFFDIHGVFRVKRESDKKTDPVIWDFTENTMDLAVDYVNEIDLGNVKNSIHIWGHVDSDSGKQVYWSYRNRWERINKSELEGLTDKETGDICHIRSEDKSYVWDGVKWEILDFTVSPLFNMETVGEKTLAIPDDLVQSDEQAKLRCEYELLNYSSFAETVSFTCLPIYFLETNNKIKLKDKRTGIDGEYVITDISIPLSFDGLMSVSARKLYY